MNYEHNYYYPLPPPPPAPIVVAVEEPKVGVTVNETYIPLGTNNMTLPSLQPSVNPDMPISTLQNIQVNSLAVPFSGNSQIQDVGVSTINQPSIIGVQPNPTHAGNTPIYATNDTISQQVSLWSLYPAVSVVYASTISTNSIITNNLSSSSAFISTIKSNLISTLEIDTGNIFASFIDIDGQILTADPDQLFLNGLPIATTASLSTIADWALFDAISTVKMNNNDIIEAKTIYSDAVSTLNCITANIEANYIDTNYIQTNYASVSTIAGTYGSFDEVDVSTLQFNSGVALGALTTDASASTLFYNNVPIFTGTPISGSNWSQYPAIQTVDMASNGLNNVGSFTMPASLTNNFNVGGGSVLTPVSQNNQFALTTKIVNVSPVTPMEITSLGGINMTANATTGTQEFNISFIGASGNDMNITAPDINLTCTDATSFMNLTAPAGVTIAGGGLFIASGVLEAIGAGDIKLLSGGNVQIGSGNLFGATTQVEKFEFLDCNVNPMNGINHLYLCQVEISNVFRDAGSEGTFSGRFLVNCRNDTFTNVQSATSNAQQVTWQVQADQAGSVYKSMNLTSVGSNQPIRFNMTANSNSFMTTYNSGNTVSYTTSGGDANFAGIGTINASSQLSAPTVSGTNGNFSNLNISSLNTFNVSSTTVGTSSILADYGLFHTLRTDASTIALGLGAGENTRCIILNASGLPLNPVASDSTYIKPLRNVSTQPAGTAFTMGYTSATGEVVVGNIKINAIESTIQNTQRISYDEGILTTAIDGLLQVNGQAQFTESVSVDTTLNVLETANISSLKLYGIPGTSAPNALFYNSTTTQVSYAPITTIVQQPAFVYYVATNGRAGASGTITDPLSTIAEALTKPAKTGAVDPPGMIIYVAPGAYSEDITIPVSLTLPSVSIIGMSNDTDDSKQVQIRGSVTITGTDVTLVNTVNSVTINNIAVFAKNTGLTTALTMTGRGYRVYLQNGLYTSSVAMSVPLISLAGTNGLASNATVQLVINNCSMSCPTSSTGNIVNVSGGSLFEIKDSDLTQRGTSALAVQVSGGTFSSANNSNFEGAGACISLAFTSTGLANFTNCLIRGSASPTVAILTIGANANLNLSNNTIQNTNTVEANNTSRYLYLTAASLLVASIRNNFTSSATSPITQMTPYQSTTSAVALYYFANIYTNASNTVEENLPVWASVRQFSNDILIPQFQVTASSATPIALNASVRGRTYILTGTTTQPFTTTGLTATDAGFCVIVHNGNGTGGGDINITGATGTTIVHNRTIVQNGQNLYLFWNGTGLVGY